MTVTDEPVIETGEPSEVTSGEGLEGSEPTSTPEPQGDTLDQGPATESQPEPIFEIDGQAITLDEARSGYLRQADYTRKTQELAAQRQEVQHAAALAAALDRDPQSALTAIAQAYGVPLGSPTPAPQAPQAPQGQGDDLWGEDPAEGAAPQGAVDPAIAQKLDQFEQFMQQERLRAAQDQIDREIQTLRSQYGDVDEAALIDHTLRGGFPNLTVAYRDMNFDRLTAAQQREAKEADRTEAKRQAAKVQQGGGAPTGAPTAPQAPQKFGSFAEAAKAAREAVGI